MKKRERENLQECMRSPERRLSEANAGVEGRSRLLEGTVFKIKRYLLNYIKEHRQLTRTVYLL